MRGIALALALAAGGGLAGAQYDPKSPLEQATLTLARIRLAASRDFGQLPNCTCTMTVERSRRQSKRGRFELADQLRLEVGFVEGREVYSWPGAQRFEDRELVDIVRGGAIGSGEFASHARNIVVSGNVPARYAGEELIGERPAHRFDYEVPMARSRFSMRIDKAMAPVGYRGSFWADKETHQLRRLRIEIHEIPVELPLLDGAILIDYERRKLGDASFLLPSLAETSMTTLDGSESRNRTVYTNCRQYAGESSLVFDEPEESPPDAAPAPAIDWKLPKNLRLSLRLGAELAASRLAVGDVVEFTLTRDATQNREVWLPRGALVRMRVSYVRCVESPVSACALGLRPDSFVAGPKRGLFDAEMEAPALAAMLGALGPRSTGQGVINRIQRDPFPPGSSLLILPGRRLASGYQTVWRTLEGSGDKDP
jgi:hypothetical protein